MGFFNTVSFRLQKQKNYITIITFYVEFLLDDDRQPTTVKTVRGFD